MSIKAIRYIWFFFFASAAVYYFFSSFLMGALAVIDSQTKLVCAIYLLSSLVCFNLSLFGFILFKEKSKP